MFSSPLSGARGLLGKGSGQRRLIRPAGHVNTRSYLAIYPPPELVKFW